MKLHLVSDVHLETRDNYQPMPLPSVQGDVCILAGDIGVTARPEQYIEYIRLLKTQFNEVVFIAGNHEFYHSSYSEGLDMLSKIAQETGSHFLDIDADRNEFVYEGVTIWGSTLWTDLNQQSSAHIVSHYLNDYRAIRGFTASQSYDIHTRTVDAINWNADVVVTHHMPILRKHSRFPMEPMIYGFNCTELEEKIAHGNIKYWLYGHTHDNVATDLKNTRVCCNQMGYPNEPMLPYDPSFLIEIEKQL